MYMLYYISERELKYIRHKYNTTYTLLYQPFGPNGTYEYSCSWVSDTSNVTNKYILTGRGDGPFKLFYPMKKIIKITLI
jgi:hypothetical protein